MHSIGIPELKDVAEAAPGEIIRCRISAGDIFALVMKHTRDSTMIGVISAPEDKGVYPFRLSVHPPFYCLSYGTNWVISACPTKETHANNRSLTERPGCLHQTKYGLILTFAPPPKSDLEAIGFNLNTNEVCDTPTHPCAPFLYWKIWQSGSDIQAETSEPIVVVDFRAMGD
jgi:hypothetical protein